MPSWRSVYHNHSFLSNLLAAYLWMSTYSRLSAKACQLASMMLGELPTVLHVCSPSLESISTRVCAAVPAQTQIVWEDPKRLAYDEEGAPLWFKGKSAKARMSAAEFRRYERSLSSLDCPTAAWILNTAFIRTYPQYVRGRLGPNCKKNLDCFFLSHYARV